MGMGLNYDLATVAGMAGLGGSAIAAIVASLIFKGLILRIISQIVVTTVLSFIGFVALLHFLGFEIIPPKQIAGVPVPGNGQMFSAQSAPSQPQPEPGYVIRSPWSK